MRTKNELEYQNKVIIWTFLVGFGIAIFILLGLFELPKITLFEDGSLIITTCIRLAICRGG